MTISIVLALWLLPAPCEETRVRGFRNLTVCHEKATREGVVVHSMTLAKRPPLPPWMEP